MIQGLFFSTSEEHSAIYILLAHLGNDYVWTAHWINCRGFGSLCMHTVKKIHYIFFISNNLKIKIRYRVSSAVFVVGRGCTVPTPLHGKAWLRHWPTLCKDTSVLGQLISNGQSRQEYQDLTILAQQGTSLRGGVWRKAPELPGERGEVGRGLDFEHITIQCPLPNPAPALFSS